MTSSESKLLPDRLKNMTRIARDGQVATIMQRFGKDEYGEPRYRIRMAAHTDGEWTLPERDVKIPLSRDELVREGWQLL